MSHLQSTAHRHLMHLFAKEITLCSAGSIFFTLLSQLAFPLPFTPIPITLQTLAVILLGGVLGSKRAALCIMFYLVQATCGLPVLCGGKVNPLWFLDKKAGYLISFICAAFLIGKMIEKRPQGDMLTFFLAGLIGHTLILAIGMFWLAGFIGVKKAFLLGVLPFLIGGVLKTAIGALILKGYLSRWPSLSKNRGAINFGK